jgi:RNA polymerase sigma-70 factor (ECF subfamily)
VVHLEGQDESSPGIPDAELARHGLSIRRYLAGMLRPDEIEDAAQTVLQRALEHRGRFRGDSSPRVWMLGIARNVGLEVARARQKAVARTYRPAAVFGAEAPKTEDLLTAGGPDQEDRLGRKEQQALALVALDGLSLDDKLALLVTYVDGLAGPEAADILDLSFPAFRQRLSRARANLRKSLNGLMDSGDPGSAEVMAQWQALLDPRPKQ